MKRALVALPKEGGNKESKESLLQAVNDMKLLVDKVQAKLENKENENRIIALESLINYNTALVCKQSPQNFFHSYFHFQISLL